MKKLINIILIGIICTLFIGCKSHTYILEVPVTTSHSDTIIRTLYLEIEKHDSIYIKDSTNTVIKGDTVFTTKYKYLYKYILGNNIKRQQDTIIKVDSIPVVLTKSKVVEVNKLSWWQTGLVYFGGFAICIGLLALLIIYTRYLKTYKK